MINPGSADGSRVTKLSAVFDRAWVRVTNSPIAQPKSPHSSAAPAARVTELMKPSCTRGFASVREKLSREIVSHVSGTPGAGRNARRAKPSTGPRVIANAMIHVTTVTGHFALPSESFIVPPPLTVDDARLDTR